MDAYVVTISKGFSREDIEDIVVTALEGGIGYWACLDNEKAPWDEYRDSSEPVSKIAMLILERKPSENCWLAFSDAEDEDAPSNWMLDMSKLLNGIKLAVESGCWNGDMDEVDADVADSIFQYAIFGEIVYG